MWFPAKGKLNRGFTLLELLVVIAIIGILSSVVLASLNSSREKASNAAILSQMNEYQKALELYYSDEGVYPHNWGGALRARVLCLGEGVGTEDCLGTVSFGSVIQDVWNASIETAFGRYLSQLPREEFGAFSSPAYSGCSSSGPNYAWNSPTNNCAESQYSIWFLLAGADEDCGDAVRADGTFGTTNDLTLCRLMP